MASAKMMGVPMAGVLGVALIVVGCGDGEATTTTTGSGAGGTGGEGTGAGATGGGGEGTGAAGGSMGTGGSGASGGGGVGGGASVVEQCTDCANPLLSSGGACESAVMDCLNDASCDMWAECTETCFASDPAFTAACFDQCEAANPQGQALYQAIYDCLCMTCAADCAPMCG